MTRPASGVSGVPADDGRVDGCLPSLRQGGHVPRLDPVGTVSLGFPVSG
jgi:hypothetical protein